MTRQQIRDLSQLHRRRGRTAQGAFLVEGVRSVEAAVAAGAPLLEIVVGEDASQAPRVAHVLARAQAAGIAVETVAPHEVARISDAQAAQGIVAVSRQVVQDRAEALAGVSSVLLLDGVQDPGNVGALVRTAAWFGVEAVVVDAKSADPEGPKAVRAAMGGLWDLALVRLETLAEALDGLRAAGVAVWGADMGGADAAAWSPPARTALVMGSEAHGLSDGVAARLDGRVSIARGASAAGRGPGVESLNVVVAAGVLMARWRG